MIHVSSGTHRQFKSLIDLIAADHLAASNESPLGPSVGDDSHGAPALTVLGPCVGDDNISDTRLKEDVRRIGTTVFGLPLYQFKYRGKPEIYEGVMAQEVLKVMPGAVSVGADGFYRVNYRALGTAMRRVS
jgi:Chaperone of endosialidase